MPTPHALPFGPRRVYVAASWRNPYQPAFVARLRAEGHEVYDFRNPAPGVTGFSWRKILDTPPPWSAEETMRVLAHPEAEAGFKADYDAMKWADTFVMLQPSGRSAALELGWAAGAGKLALVFLVDGQEPEFMLKVADRLFTSTDDILAALRTYDPASRTFGTPATPSDPALERSCRGCEFSGYDPDGPYCVEAHVAEGFRHGVALHTLQVATRCPYPEHPHWRPRNPVNPGGKPLPISG